jgi:DeoR/GlpR family transcriptional regulator of sugar metabolism
MDVRERRALILQLIETEGEVSVRDLSRRIGVSEMTVRRDLETLASRGALIRLHGRAVAPVSRSYEPPFDVRAGTATEAKARIGALAANLIEEGETVVLDVGTTTLEVARALRGRRNLTVLTPSLRIANVLAEEPGIRLMVCGGILRPGELSLVGDLAVAAFRDFRFDTAVLGVGGIDVTAGLTEYNLEDARVKRAAVETARRILVVADATKLGRVAFARICPLAEIDVLVTDRSAPADLVAAIKEAGVEVRVA